MDSPKFTPERLRRLRKYGQLVRKKDRGRRHKVAAILALLWAFIFTIQCLVITNGHFTPGMFWVGAPLTALVYIWHAPLFERK